MADDRKVSAYVPIPTKQEHRTHPGRTRETKAERELRYEAQLVAEREGIPLIQATEIAKHLAAEREKACRQRESRKAEQKQNLRERRHDLSKRDTTPIVKTHGLPRQGGAPGLGKRR